MNIEKDQKNSSTVVVVMPAYNAEKTLHRCFSEIPTDSYNHIILVDDGSIDNTVQVAKNLNITVFQHNQNYGYGANQKTCYCEALKHDYSIIVMLHPDYQYDPKLLPSLISPIINGKADVVFGSRLLGANPVGQGMPRWKYLGNKILNFFENKVFNLNLSEYHTGYRAYSRYALSSVNYLMNSDGFDFDQEIIAQFVSCGFTIGEVPVPTKYFPEASSINRIKSIFYGIKIFVILLKYLLHKYGIKVSPQFINYRARY
jgi:glycosyltransferase involved in cell wall biosynthesis